MYFRQGYINRLLDNLNNIDLVELYEQVKDAYLKTDEEGAEKQKVSKQIVNIVTELEKIEAKIKVLENQINDLYVERQPLREKLYKMLDKLGDVALYVQTAKDVLIKWKVVHGTSVDYKYVVLKLKEILPIKDKIHKLIDKLIADASSPKNYVGRYHAQKEKEKEKLKEVDLSGIFSKMKHKIEDFVNNLLKGILELFNLGKKLNSLVKDLDK